MRPALPALLSILLLALLLPACGGGGGGAATPDSILLLAGHYDYNGGRSVVVNDMRFELGHADPMTGVEYYRLFVQDPRWTTADVGQTRTYETNATPELGMFAQHVADGLDGRLAFRSFLNGAESGGRHISENIVWAGGFDGTLVPDAAGYLVTRLEVELTRAVLNTPGSDPNGDGNYTEYQLTWELRVYGYRDTP